MISVYPSFYKDFLCKAGDCLHSCCIQSWDIDIDEATARKYLSMKGSLGRELTASISCKDGIHSFIMKDGRCPFLRKDGLCRIILESGDENLCDICAIHPRFFVYTGDFELAGVGLCCEKSVELLLQEETPLAFVTDRSSEPFHLGDLLTALGHPATENELCFHPRVEAAYYGTILSALEKTEPIDTAWMERLAALTASVNSIVRKAASLLSSYPASAFNRIYQYILYRTLEKAEVYGFPPVMAYARQSADFIFLETAVYGELEENIRRWSEQVEYDTDNVDILLSLLADSSGE